MESNTRIMQQVYSIFIAVLLFLPFSLEGQIMGENKTPTYDELIREYQKLAKDHDEIKLYNMGTSDVGEPIYLCLINQGIDSLDSFKQAKEETTILINNGIHPGEPDGINACLMWIDNWIKGGKEEAIPTIAIIPAYNVGGMMNRSGTSRANQEGPEEYGFRGNAQNLDLNRDFIKMDSENMKTFARIFHALDPDVFIDTHVSNGADYQYTLTYISSVKERMDANLAKLLYGSCIPYISAKLKEEKEIHMIPYVNLVNDVPEKGMSVFNDLPRYSMGYASLFHSLSFTIETHMLKPFHERVIGTLGFLEYTIKWTERNKNTIEVLREKARKTDVYTTEYLYNYELDKQADSIEFLGYEYTYEKSDVTGLKRLKYHRDQPYKKMIPYYSAYTAKDTTNVPEFYLIGGQCKDVINRLKANNVELIEGGEVGELFNLTGFRVMDYETGKRPYEGHYLHTNISVNEEQMSYVLKSGDIIVPTNQDRKRFIVSVLEPEMPDSYFAWNYFDSYLQQKEYFSPYVFEDKATELLEENPGLKKEFEERKKNDKEFRGNSWGQLYFIYQRSPYYEPTHNLLPVFKGNFEE